MQTYLAATPFFDYQHPAVQQWAEDATRQAGDDPVTIAQALYLRARDDARYNPYTAKAERATMSASHVLESGESYCIPKAVLLGAAARYKGIPSRLGLADVKNHLSSPRLIEWLGSDIFHMHGFIELHLNGRWVKATPAFDKRLCRFMGVAPLPFDGVNDSIFQPYAEDGSAHMEYLTDHGTFADVPYDFIWKVLSEAYPHLFADDALTLEGVSLEDDMRRA